MVFTSSEGQAATIAERVATEFGQLGLAAEVAEADLAPARLDAYDVVVLGGSIHVGRHQKALEAFAKAHHDELNRRPSAFFSVSLTAVNPDEEHQATARKLADEFLAATEWTPDAVAVFGGALKYRRYNVVKRFILRRIARKEGGDTDTSRDWEYTDWEAVRSFAQTVASLAGEVRAKSTA